MYLKVSVVIQLTTLTSFFFNTLDGLNHGCETSVSRIESIKSDLKKQSRWQWIELIKFQVCELPFLWLYSVGLMAERLPISSPVLFPLHNIHNMLNSRLIVFFSCGCSSWLLSVTSFNLWITSLATCSLRATGVLRSGSGKRKYI